MKKFTAAILVVVVLFAVGVPTQKASADPIMITQIAASAYTIAQASGLQFVFSGYDGADTQSWMENRINSWLNGRTIAEAFGTEMIRLELGKLVIPMKIVNGIKDFLSDLIQDNGIQEETATTTTIQSAAVNGQVYNTSSPVGVNSATNPFAQVYDFDQQPTQGQISATYTTEVSGTKRYYYFTAYNYSGSASQTKTLSLGVNDVVTWMKYGLVADISTNRIWVYYVRYNAEASNENNKYSFASIGNAITIPAGAEYTGDVGASIPGTYVPPEGLNDLQEWQGKIEGGSDTNLEDLLDDIFQDAGDNDLTIEDDEVVDVPSVPTPVPTAEPGTDTNIGEIVGGIADTVGDIAGTLEGVQEGVDSISETLEGVGSDVGDIAEALEVPAANQLKLPDLRTLFPFCIPFDLYNIISAFAVEPEAPHVQIPFNIPRIGLEYTFDFDFSSFNTVAQVCRTMEFIAFAIGLAILTSKVIRW